MADSWLPISEKYKLWEVRIMCKWLLRYLLWHNMVFYWHTDIWLAALIHRLLRRIIAIDICHQWVNHIVFQWLNCYIKTFFCCVFVCLSCCGLKLNQGRIPHIWWSLSVNQCVVCYNISIEATTPLQVININSQFFLAQFPRILVRLETLRF